MSPLCLDAEPSRSNLAMEVETVLLTAGEGAVVVEGEQPLKRSRIEARDRTSGASTGTPLDSATRAVLVREATGAPEVMGSPAILVIPAPTTPQGSGLIFPGQGHLKPPQAQAADQEPSKEELPQESGEEANDEEDSQHESDADDEEPAVPQAAIKGEHTCDVHASLLHWYLAYMCFLGSDAHTSYTTACKRVQQPACPYPCAHTKRKIWQQSAWAYNNRLQAASMCSLASCPGVSAIQNKAIELATQASNVSAMHHD